MNYRTISFSPEVLNYFGDINEVVALLEEIKRSGNKVVRVDVKIEYEKDIKEGDVIA